MKIKCQPQDFVVTEICSRSPADGAYALYRLTKTGLGTPEALQKIQRTWNLSAKQMAHAGLKDRHAVTTQCITIRNGPRAGLDADHLTLKYLGQTHKPVDAGDIAANRFEIVVRRLTDEQAQAMVQQAHQPHAGCVPNYFDDQRFGSLGPSQEYIAAAWCRKDYEQALWLALAEYNSHDDASERQEKQILRDNWKQWSTCKELLQRSHRRSVITYLVDHPDKFRKAFALIRTDLRRIYLSAFQSAVWNRAVALLLHSRMTDPLPKLQIADAQLPFPDAIESSVFQQLARTSLPLPSARCKTLDPEMRPFCEQAAQHYGFSLSGMKVSFPRDCFFSRANRNVLLVPEDMTATAAADALYSGYHSVTLSFTLPKGCYATMVLKGFTRQPED
jgi:tRNA pseudouridine13 synthase